MQKKEILALLEHFPEANIDTEELIRELYLKAKLEHAEDEVESGETLTHEEVVRQSDQWFK